MKLYIIEMCALALCWLAIHVHGLPLEPSKSPQPPTTTTGTMAEVHELNKKCQDNDKTTVYEKVLGMCITCFSCDQESTDDHCVTCRALGVIPGKETPTPTGSLEGGTDVDDHGHILGSVDPTFGGVTMGDPFGRSTNTTSSEGRPLAALEANDVPPDSSLGLPLTAGMVTVVGVPILVFGVYILKRRRVHQRVPTQETGEPERVPKQETGTPERRHPSDDLTDVIPPNHEFSESEARV